MFKKFLDSFSRSPAPPTRPPVAGPYAQSETNFIYQLLFCDDPTLFRTQPEIAPASWQNILFGDPPDPAAVRGLAESATEPSRIKLLAYNWLRQNRQQPSRKELLGVVIEVPLKTGLDVIAAYADGSIRYINQSGRFTIFEGVPTKVETQASQLLAVSRTAITHIGPWDRARLPAPSRGKMRMTFLVSDGLYFGEGPFPGMERDPVAAPVISEAGKLLQLVVDLALAENN
jgi:hypothetical protein